MRRFGLGTAQERPISPSATASLRRAKYGAFSAVVLSVSLSASPAAAQPAMPDGAKAFGYCAPCHSLEKGVNLTGPSLHGLWGRNAASLSSFHRYSDALKQSGIVWNDQTLDAWIRDPAALVPDNEMRFPGIAGDGVRGALIAFLRSATKEEDGGARRSDSAAGTGTTGRMGGMGGMGMGGGALPDLKQAPAAARVRSVRYCDDTYTVTTEGGQTLRFWEFNLRFKTDSGPKGPRRNEPVLVPQGMQRDRAQLVFASPDEIGRAIKRECKR